MIIIHLLLQYREARKTQKAQQLRQQQWEMKWNTYFKTGEF